MIYKLQLVIRHTRLSTVGDRAFPVAGSRLWNSLPPVVTSVPTLTVFSEPPQDSLPFFQIISLITVVCIYSVSTKHPNIFSCNLNKYFPISIIFGTSIT